MKTIIAVFNSADKGKTATIREFANQLLVTYPSYIPIVPIPATIPVSGDFRLIVNINGKIIGIESQGDPGTRLRERLEDLADNFNCDIIICTSRTKGKNTI